MFPIDSRSWFPYYMSATEFLRRVQEDELRQEAFRTLSEEEELQKAIETITLEDDKNDN